VEATRVHADVVVENGGQAEKCVASIVSVVQAAMHQFNWRP
jgi:hypothetical protein